MRHMALISMLRAMGINHPEDKQQQITGFVPTKVCDICGEPADLTTTDCDGKEHHTCDSCLKAAFNGVQ